MRLLTILSILLDYPQEEMRSHLDEIEALVLGDSEIRDDERDAVQRVISWMRTRHLIGLQQHYVQTFDLAQGNSLHLTFHAYGDDRNRGPALIELVEHYRAHGYELPERELPDYLPLMLEYASQLDPMAARLFLHEFSGALTKLADNLEASDDPYAPLMRIVENRARLVEGASPAIRTATAHTCNGATI